MALCSPFRSTFSPSSPLGLRRSCSMATLWLRCTYTVPKLGIRCDYAKTMRRRRYTHPKAPRGLRWDDGGMESSAACLVAKAGQVQRKGGRKAEGGEGIPKTREWRRESERQKAKRSTRASGKMNASTKTLPYPGPSQATGRLYIVSDGHSHLFASQTLDLPFSVSIPWISFLFFATMGFRPPVPPQPFYLPLRVSFSLPLPIPIPHALTTISLSLSPNPAPSPSPGSPSQRRNWTQSQKALKPKAV